MNQMLNIEQRQKVFDEVKDFKPEIFNYEWSPEVIWSRQNIPEVRPLVVLSFLNKGLAIKQHRFVGNKLTEFLEGQVELDTLTIYFLTKNMDEAESPTSEVIEGDRLANEYLRLLRKYINGRWDRFIPGVKLNEPCKEIIDTSFVLGVEHHYQYNFDVPLQTLEVWERQTPEIEVEGVAPTLLEIQFEVERIENIEEG